MAMGKRRRHDWVNMLDFLKSNSMINYLKWDTLGQWALDEREHVKKEDSRDTEWSSSVDNDW